MDKIFYINSVFKTISADNNGLYIEGYASTDSVDRVGDVITADAWTQSNGLKNFEKNPIILYNHNYSKPIGKATEIKVDSKGLFIKAKISPAAADNVPALIEDGILGAYSVGIRIKDAEYSKATDGFLIKDVELYEVSVVTVPANQDATFQLAKSFDTTKEYEEFKASFIDGQKSEEEVKTDPAPKTPEVVDKSTKQEIKEMDPKDLEALLASVAQQTAKAMSDAQAEKEAAQKAAEKEAAEKAKKDEETAAVIAVSVKTAAEKLMEDIEARFNNRSEELEKIVTDLKGELEEKGAEIVKLRESKRIFSDRQDGGDWKVKWAKELDDAKILSLVTKKDWRETKYGKELIEKVNVQSGVEVSSQDFEQIVSTNIERDIQNALILAPMFREIQMNAASLILPILPDSGYAEFTTNQTASGGQTKGNLAERGDAYGSPYGGVTLQERILTTKKLISRSYLGNETEEDAILPILPLIRESMIRSHARAVESSILVGNTADGPFGTAGASYDGLVFLANGDSHKTQGGANTFANTTLTAAALMTARKNMGKYGVRPEDVVYIVSQRSYFELIEDPEFQDMNLVGPAATKITGQIGQVYGSPVVLCDEFATPAVSKYYAIAVNTRNFIRPRLRGLTVEADYDVENQRRVLVASQRLGFLDLFDGVSAKWALQYGAS